MYVNDLIFRRLHCFQIISSLHWSLYCIKVYNLFPDNLYQFAILNLISKLHIIKQC
jgi:hypothetical protein